MPLISEDNSNSDYLNWKEWSIDNFAQLSAFDKRYFDSELKSLPIEDGSPPLQILEIGFGNGKFLQYCVDLGWNITGTEINPLLVQIAKEKGFHAVLSENLLELADEQFDLVVAFDVLEHIPQDKIIFFLTQIKRVLKQDGICLLRFPNGDSPFGLANQNGDVTHVTAIGSEKIKFFASQASLDLITCRGEREPLLEKSLSKTLRKVVSIIFKKIINGFIYLVFYKKRNYCSDNLVVILKKTRA
ncbi:bifunctional 2-polyprenyl-6-hydroxyphenol methylase/3-demethylubiquinol 3-O-methyltransferase UbiG [Polynucleobacter sp. UB-Piko-W3]|uniref:class I SAM-dependent methyltransferase n=1 Tax=Polynucleobacter sp. UB-Piko-W3 TaxID=1819735 RepID=UPI001C0E39BC|nr:class I SAM-dependent methyltransferase [Polynucleobacter sp. UB-Piko-W3]MBU3555948.1 class I SAM-dependent methyltransferase [Polynucleobacter sp. UB-Piko-W3]